MKGVIASTLLVSVLFSSAGIAAGEESQAQRDASAVARAFVSALPLGTPVELKLDDGSRIKGTLVGSEVDTVIVRMRTRLAEPPRTLALDRIVDADVDRGTSMGKAVAAGVAAGAGTALGVLFFLLSVMGD